MNAFVIKAQIERKSIEKMCECRVLHCKSMTVHRRGVHLRVGGGLANRGLGTVLLQIADVSASSTSCCQALKHIFNQKCSHLIFTYYRNLCLKASAAKPFVDYCAEGYILAWWSLSDIHTLPPVPGTVRIPGEDALPAALIISAVSYWDLHQFRERGNVKLTLWRRRQSRGREGSAPNTVTGLLISSRFFLV